MIAISDGAAHRKSSSRYQEVRYMQVSKVVTWLLAGWHGICRIGAAY